MTNQTYAGIVWRQGTKVLLCPPDMSCAKEACGWINNEDNSRFLVVNTPFSLAAEKEWLQDCTKFDPNDFVVFLRTHEGTLIGNMSITIRPEHGSATTGTLIGNRKFQRGGYATEAKLLLLRYAFHERGLRKVVSKILGPNRASVKYARRCGYTFTARIPAEHYRFGKWRSELIYTAWPETWQEAWNSFYSVS